MFWEFINLSSDVEQRSKNLNKTSWFTLWPLQYEYNHLISLNVVVFKFGILNHLPHLPLAVNVWIILSGFPQQKGNSIMVQSLMLCQQRGGSVQSPEAPKYKPKIPVVSNQAQQFRWLFWGVCGVFKAPKFGNIVYVNEGVIISIINPNNKWRASHTKEVANDSK